MEAASGGAGGLGDGNGGGGLGGGEGLMLYAGSPASVLSVAAVIGQPQDLK